MTLYVLDGRTPRPAEGVGEWSNQQEAIGQRRVAYTEVASDATVSTVFVGIDRNATGVGPPLLFETMVFGGLLNGEVVLYATWDEAERGHTVMVERAQRASEERGP